MAEKTVYVSFSAEINQSTTESFLAFCAKHVNEGVEHLYVLLSTAGGSVMNGLNVYNVLRALPVKITIHNVGNVDSVGNVMFLAGEERYAAATATFMFHGVGFDVTGGARLEERLLRERLSSLLSDQRRIAAVMRDRANVTSRQVAALFRQGVTKDPAWAKEVGIIHDIRDVNLPAGVPLFQLVFQR